MAVNDVNNLEEQSKYINMEEGLGRILGNKKIYKALLQSFLKSTTWEQLKKELESKDIEAASKSAHNIKGMTANLSFPATNKKIIELEKKLISGEDFTTEMEQYENLLSDTCEFINRIMSEIE